MTAHTPPATANSVMSAATGAASGKQVVLLDCGSYPSYSNLINQTYNFTGAGLDWSAVSTATPDPNGPLPCVSNASGCYDGTNVVLFGGIGGSSTSGIFGSTWVWSSAGQTWSQKTNLTVSPIARYNAEMAYLAGTGAVLFGGENTLYPLLDTIVWNGTTWSQITVANGAGPAARIGHHMAASASQVILFGGQAGGDALFNDTWSFSAGAWTQLFPTTPPSVRSNGAFAYDVANSRFVLFGGENTSGVMLNELWTLNNGATAWTQVSLPNGTGPSARIGASMAYDAGSSSIIMFGGTSATTGYPSSQTWQLKLVSTVNTWTLL